MGGMGGMIQDGFLWDPVGGVGFAMGIMKYKYTESKNAWEFYYLEQQKQKQNKSTSPWLSYP